MSSGGALSYWREAVDRRGSADDAERRRELRRLSGPPHDGVMHGRFGLAMVDGAPVFTRPDGMALADGPSPSAWPTQPVMRRAGDDAAGRRVGRQPTEPPPYTGRVLHRFRVDLRSDTVTTPSAAMRRAMADAEVGDDWYGDDPTVNRLQERAAEMAGKEAALYVPTGTMANQIGLRLHFEGTGHLVVAEANGHVATTEVMTSAVLSGIAFRTMRGDARGQVTTEQVAEALEPDEYYDVEMIDVLAVENTHGATGGHVMAIDDLRAYRKIADDRGVPMHLDGARIFNAAVASGVDVAEYCAEVDTMMFCVSKGLGAPIGSLLCGPAELMPEARRIKILVGGAWRQAGIMAAAGLIALEEGPKRLHEDHARARRLADALAEILPGSVDPESVETNMVLVDTGAAGMATLEAIRRLAVLGVGTTIQAGKVRMVTHVDISDEDVQTTIGAWRQMLAA